MRTFDYQHLPAHLFDGHAGDGNVRLHEDRGKFELLKQVYADELEAMRERAHFDNVEASLRIDGIYVDSGRTRELLAGAQPLGDTESQIVGYSNALRAIGSKPDAFDLSTTTILAFYEVLYAGRDLGRKSRYRKKDYQYVQVDGHMQAMPVSPISAFETPLVLGAACDSLTDAFSADGCSPLILNAVFTVDFLCVRPFEEGNGRIARLFSSLMLQKAGFDVFRYVSIDRIIEGAAMDYYDALNACVEGWDRCANDYGPYVTYWLDVVHRAYAQVFDRLSVGGGSKLGKSERVRLAVKRAGRPVTKRELMDELPDVSEATVENALGKLVKDGEAEKVGAGRSTAYRWL